MAESTEQPVQIAVENARKELSGVIQSLTTVLQAVAVSISSSLRLSLR